MSKRSKRVSRPEVFPSGTSRSAPAEFNPDYSFVIRDLRRIGILAGAFLVVLVVLAFFI